MINFCCEFKSNDSQIYTTHCSWTSFVFEVTFKTKIKIKQNAFPKMNLSREQKIGIVLAFFHSSQRTSDHLYNAAWVICYLKRPI